MHAPLRTPAHTRPGRARPITKQYLLTAYVATACLSAHAGISTVAIDGQRLGIAGKVAAIDFSDPNFLRAQISDHGDVAFRQRVVLDFADASQFPTINAVWSQDGQLNVIAEQTTGLGFPLVSGERGSADDAPTGGSFRRGSSSIYYRGVLVRENGSANAAMFSTAATGQTRLQTFTPGEPGISGSARRLIDAAEPVVAVDGSFITVGTEADGKQRLYRWSGGTVNATLGTDDTIGSDVIVGIGSDSGFNASVGYADSGEIVLVAMVNDTATSLGTPSLISIDSAGAGSILATDSAQLTLVDGSSVTAYLRSGGRRPIDISRRGTIGILSAPSAAARADLLIRKPGQGFLHIGQIRSVTNDPIVNPGDIVRSRSLFGGLKGQLTASDAGTLAGVASEVQADTSTIDVVWTASEADGIRVLARDDGSAPGLDEGGVFDFSSPLAQFAFDLTANELGQVAFTSRFTGDGVGTGLWAQDLSGTLVLAARTGQDIEYVPGMFATIVELSIDTDANRLTPFNERVFNMNGQIAFNARLDNGVQGLFVATIPALPTVMPITILCLYGPARRGRLRHQAR